MKEMRRNIILGRALMSGFDVKGMSRRSGMALSTTYKRIRLPGTLTLDELTSIDRAVHFTDEEIVRLVRNK